MTIAETLNSSLFRSETTIMILPKLIPLLLLTAAVMLLVGCGGNAEPISSPTPYPTPTSVPQPTVTPLPLTSTPIPQSATPVSELTAMPTSTLVPPTATAEPTPTAKPTASPTPIQTPTPQIFVKWSNWETGEWSPSSTPPKCGPLEDMFDVFPLDIAVVDEFTPPGRPGGDGSYYISHGHLRSHNTPHDQITVKFPAEGFSLYAASRRLQDYSVHGKTSTDEEQVKLHFHHPCGIKIMIDHIAQITDRWSEITENVPVLVNDSRETFMPDGQYFVESGEVLGYAIGHSTNTYLDFGVYDLREKNDVSEIMERDFPQYAPTASHGICWANLFGAETQKLLEGKAVSSSDFCEIPTLNGPN